MEISPTRYSIERRIYSTNVSHHRRHPSRVRLAGSVSIMTLSRNPMITQYVKQLLLDLFQ